MAEELEVWSSRQSGKVASVKIPGTRRRYRGSVGLDKLSDRGGQTEVLVTVYRAEKMLNITISLDQLRSAVSKF